MWDACCIVPKLGEDYRMHQKDLAYMNTLILPVLRAANGCQKEHSSLLS